jgi:hypothetical protein
MQFRPVGGSWPRFRPAGAGGILPFGQALQLTLEDIQMSNEGMVEFDRPSIF